MEPTKLAARESTPLLSQRSPEAGRDSRDCAVESTRSERDSLPDVGEHEVAFDFALECDLCPKVGASVSGCSRMQTSARD